MAKRLTVEYLASESSFIAFCLQQRPDDIKYWEEYLQNHAEDRAVIEEARRMVVDIHGAFVLNERDRSLKVLDAHISGRGRSRMIWQYWQSIAAVIVVLLCIGGLLYQSYDGKKKVADDAFSYASGIGQRKEIKLMDGSVVVLNAASTMRIASDFGEKERTVFLTGEAYFDVARYPDKPFIIHTELMDIKVLGTQFNVRSYSDDTFAHAALVEGAIEVTLLKEDRKKVILKPADKIVVSRSISSDGAKEKPEVTHELSRITNSEAKKPVETQWMSNKLAFQHERLADITATLERWYGVKFVFRDEQVKNLEFTATFKNGEALEEILLSLQLVTPFGYQFLPDQTIVLSASVLTAPEQNESK